MVLFFVFSQNETSYSIESMNIFSNHTMNFWRVSASKLLLVVATVVIIVWALPRNEGTTYHYDIGKPWTYGAFIAKYDFPIYKTDETIKHEEDSLMRFFQPYYNYNENVGTEVVTRFLTDFKQGMPGLPAEYVDTIANRLRAIYQVGIINTPEYNNIYKDSTSTIRVVRGKSAQSVRLDKVYSTIAAYERLFLHEDQMAHRQLLQKCNLTNYIEANLTYDKEKSETERTDLLSAIPLASGMVMAGQKVIDRGEIVDDYAYRVLNSFEREMQRRSSTQAEITTSVVGQTLYVLMLVVLFTTYLTLFRKDYFQKMRNIMMLYAMIVIFPVLVSLMMRHNVFSVYIIPFAMAAIFVRVFMDSRTAFITHTTMTLICAAAVRYQYEFIIIQLVAGLVATYSLRDLSRRAQVFKTALLVTIATAAVYLALQMMQENDIMDMDTSAFSRFVINGVFLLLAYPMMYIIEKTFGFISNVTLFELSNTNKGILRNLSEIAPGTFQHSITVGNLAAEIANRIEANSLLVRTGALYHDIGKMTNPVFFTENQVSVNPHDRLSYKESAQIIINHVTEGVKLAEKYGLPDVIKQFIRTHHGHGVVKYFYVKYKNEHPDEDVDITPFQYPGENPFTREQAILMMADSVEAASRSLPEYTEESISALVNKVIDSQVEDGFYKECPITFLDIAQAKSVLIERLKSIYHTRIQYPELKKDGNKEGKESKEEENKAEGKE